MVRKTLALGVLCVVLSAAGAAEAVRSGPQPGDKVPGPFKPHNATGPDAGQEECLYCKNGSKPVAMVFVRELSPAVVGLIKKLDAATAANRDRGMASCVIVLSDSKDLPAGLARWAQAEKVANTILATYPATGPAKYTIAPDAAVTALVYVKQTVKANHSFRTGELTDAGADAVLADVARVLPRE